MIGRLLSHERVKVEDRIPHAEHCSLYQRAQPKHLKRKNWRRQERRANALVGARETPASGALGKDGDGRLFHQWRVESKQTQEDHFLLRQDTWHKLVSGALLAGEEPVLHVELNSGKCRQVIIREELYAALEDHAPHTAPGLKNRLSFRLEPTARPLRIELEPIGVMVLESTFERLKEKL